MLFAAGIILTALAAIYVLKPLFREPKGNLEVELLAETELDRLLNRKAVIYSNIKDLDFEHEMGRLGDADFQRLEASLKAEAGEILNKLDKLGVDKEIDEGIERAVAARREKLAQGQRRRSATCPSCGAEVAEGKQFCADCGRRILP